MRLLCLSDMHGELRHYESPAHNAHVAVIAGDVTPATHAYYGGMPSENGWHDGRIVELAFALSELDRLFPTERP